MKKIEKPEDKKQPKKDSTEGLSDYQKLKLKEKEADNALLEEDTPVVPA